MDVQGARMLVLEVDALIASDAEDMLLGLGARTVQIANTLAAATAILEREPIDLAMLDVRIGSNRSDGFAHDLAARTVPFIFTTGYGPDAGLPETLRAVPRVGKPYTSEALREAFAALARRSTA
jgi:CheY-like chemotaxis protein